MKTRTMLPFINAALCSILAGMVLYTPLSALVGCAHPGQAAVHVGQCLLDDGVLSDVLDALSKPDYVKQVENIGLTRTSDLIDCALQAIVAQPTGSGSGSQTIPARTFTTQPDTLSRRASEVLATRRSAGAAR